MRTHYDFSQGVKGKYAGKVDSQRTPTSTAKQWHHPSVKALAGSRDPVQVVVEKARELVLKAVDAGILKVPVDPFKLAELHSISVIPKPDVADAQLVPGRGNTSVIEYNPNRPLARIRFSICHELGHTLFPDHAQQVRHRLFHSRISPKDYELEALCNLAAAELLLPLGSVQEDIAKHDFSVETALKLRLKYEASTEAVLLRLAGLCGTECAVFAAAAEQRQEGEQSRYQLEYVKNPGKWTPGLQRGDYLPANTVVRECTAIGYTAKANEEWVLGEGVLKVEAVGISPYPNRDPNRILPRVTGLVRPVQSGNQEKSLIQFLRGNALEPRGTGMKVIAHIVNDKTPNWGAGFGKAVRNKWPAVQQRFVTFFEQTHGSKMGHTCLTRVLDDTYTFQMICQRGYAETNSPKLRYGPLRSCLEQLRQAAVEHNASVHMPRIGTGEAGGSWGLIYNMIVEELCARGVDVTVYDLPGQAVPTRKQALLFEENA